MDADTDADADSDTDTDTDTDADSGTDTELLACADASIDSLLPTTVPGTTVGAGNDATNAPCSDGAEGPDRVFAFAAPHDGRFAFTTAHTATPTVLTVIADCSGVLLDCGTSLGSGVAVVDAQMQAGNDVLVIVDGADPDGAPFVLDVFEVEATETACDDGFDNDLNGLADCSEPGCVSDPFCAPVCPEATLSSVLPATLSGSTFGLSDDGTPSCGLGAPAPDITVAFTAPSDGVYVFDTNGTSFYATLSVTDGCGGAEFDCDDSGLFASYSKIPLYLGAGQTVTLVIDAEDGVSGNFVLNGLLAPASETTCADGLDEDYDGAFDCADIDCGVDPVCAEDCANGLDDNANNAIDCVDVHCGLDPACAEDCSNGFDDDGDFFTDCVDTFCVGEPACVSPCPEDVLTGPLPISVVGSTVGETPDQFASCGSGTWGGDVTWAFTAPADGDYTFDTIGSSYDTVLYLLDGCGGTELACNDDAAGSQSLVTATLLAGQTVIVVVDGFGYGIEGDYVLNVN